MRIPAPCLKLIFALCLLQTAAFCKKPTPIPSGIQVRMNRNCGNLFGLMRRPLYTVISATRSTRLEESPLYTIADAVLQTFNMQIAHPGFDLSPLTALIGKPAEIHLYSKRKELVPTHQEWFQTVDYNTNMVVKNELRWVPDSYEGSLYQMTSPEGEGVSLYWVPSSKVIKGRLLKVSAGLRSLKLQVEEKGQTRVFELPLGDDWVYLVRDTAR